MMLRTILLSKPYQSILLSSKLQNILQTSARLGCLPGVSTNTTFYSCSGVSSHFYDFDKKRNYIKFISQIKDDKLFHTNPMDLNAVKGIKSSAFDFKKASKEFFEINMSDLKKAPLPAFWVGFAGLGPFIFPTFSSMIIGYSPVLASLELAYGITVLACIGGAKWGYLVANKEYGTWENYSLSGIPLIIATIAIATPKMFSFLLVILGLLASFIIDLNTGNFPPWYKSLRGVLTNVSVFFLFIAMLQSMIH